MYWFISNFLVDRNFVMNVLYLFFICMLYIGECVKEFFCVVGIMILVWVEVNGYFCYQVYMVINGQFKGCCGIFYEIVLKFGMKFFVE